MVESGGNAEFFQLAADFLALLFGGALDDSRFVAVGLVYEVGDVVVAVVLWLLQRSLVADLLEEVGAVEVRLELGAVLDVQSADDVLLYAVGGRSC